MSVMKDRIGKLVVLDDEFHDGQDDQILYLELSLRYTQPARHTRLTFPPVEVKFDVQASLMCGEFTPLQR